MLQPQRLAAVKEGLAGWHAAVAGRWGGHDRGPVFSAHGPPPEDADAAEIAIQRSFLAGRTVITDGMALLRCDDRAPYPVRNSVGAAILAGLRASGAGGLRRDRRQHAGRDAIWRKGAGRQCRPEPEMCAARRWRWATTRPLSSPTVCSIFLRRVTKSSCSRLLEIAYWCISPSPGRYCCGRNADEVGLPRCHALC